MFSVWSAAAGNSKL